MIWNFLNRRYSTGFGDNHVYENPGLLSFGVLFFRYHNKLVQEIVSQNTNVTSAVDVFYRARQKLIAAMQVGFNISIFFHRKMTILIKRFMLIFIFISNPRNSSPLVYAMLVEKTKDIKFIDHFHQIKTKENSKTSMESFSSNTYITHENEEKRM